MVGGPFWPPAAVEPVDASQIARLSLDYLVRHLGDRKVAFSAGSLEHELRGQLARAVHDCVSLSTWAAGEVS